MIMNGPMHEQIYKLFFHFNLLNKDISLISKIKSLRFSTCVKNIHLEGTVSQIFDLGLSVSNF